MPRLPRPHMSLSVKLAACLDALGYEQGDAKYLWGAGWTLGGKIAQCLEWLGFKPDDEIEWDHTWALGLRERTEDGGYIPDANDPRYIRPRLKETHAVKTRGNGATTAGSDVHRIAKVKRLVKKRQQIPPEVGVAIGKAIQKRAKRQWPSRPFGPSRKFNEQWRA